MVEAPCEEFRQLKSELVKLLEVPNDWKLGNRIVARNNALKWRGGDIPEGRTNTKFGVPSEYVQDGLSLSSKRGMIVDFDHKNEGERHAKDLPKVRLPTE